MCLFYQLMFEQLFCLLYEVSLPHNNLNIQVHTVISWVVASRGTGVSPVSVALPAILDHKGCFLISFVLCSHKPHPKH